MIFTCKKCGGLWSDTSGEAIAGKPCWCRGAVVTLRQIARLEVEAAQRQKHEAKILAGEAKLPIVALALQYEHERDEAVAKLTPQICDVLAERERQNAKWGEQNHEPCTWSAILTEEAGEFAEAALHATQGGANEARNMRKEAIHCAAVALQIVEWLDRRGSAGLQGSGKEGGAA